MDKNNIDQLIKISYSLRIKTLKSIYKAKSGHIGSSLSLSEILTSLFFCAMKIDRIKKKTIDKFILSKGHAAPILYSVFEELGWISLEELNNTLRQPDSRLQGHPDKDALEFLDSGSGALGQGLSISLGYALSTNITGNKINSYCIIGDGEMQEGQIWEAAMYAGSNKIENLCVILDNNKFQNEKSIDETLKIHPIELKWESFGWNVITLNGHAIDELLNAYDQFFVSDKPTIIIANTIKGSGVDFMESNNTWHAKTMNEDDYQRAIQQLESKI